MTNLKPVSVIALSIDDLAHMGYDTRLTTQAELLHLARKMGDVYVDHGFWDNLEIVAESMNLPRI